MIAPEIAVRFQNELAAASSVLIGTHLNPDGDALGCALAMSHYLDSLGKENEVICHHRAPKNLEFLPGIDRLLLSPTKTEFDLGIVLDLDSPERLGNTEPYFDSCKRVMVMDHHVPHQAPGDLRIVDTTAPATAVILTRLLISLGATITPDMATCLLTGIVTDTGSFRFRNTTAEALSLSAGLLDHGGSIATVAEEIFQRKRLASVRLLGCTLGKMVLDSEDRLAWAAVTHEDFKSTGAKDEDTEGFVNELLSIETVEIAALLREVHAGRTRCSLRSRKGYDVAEVARVFGGGGHMNAAGCTFECPPDEAVRLIVPEMRRCLASS